jgi:uncharacterized protein (DUF1330 family)
MAKSYWIERVDVKNEEAFSSRRSRDFQKIRVSGTRRRAREAIGSASWRALIIEFGTLDARQSGSA